MAFNEKWDRYKIVKVTDLDGNDRTDTRYSSNIGRICLPNGGGEGDKFFVTYLTPKSDDRFFLGTARNIKKGKDSLIITTDNSIWHFKRADSKSDQIYAPIEPGESEENDGRDSRE